MSDDGLSPSFLRVRLAETQLVVSGPGTGKTNVLDSWLDADEIVRVCETAAVATNEDDRVVTLNEKAAEYLEVEEDRLVGRSFSQVLKPRDAFDNPLRYDSSLFLHFLQDGSPLHVFECNLRKGSGRYQRFTVSVVMVLGPRPRTHSAIYILWPVMRRRKADEVIARLLNSAGYEEEGLGAGLRASRTFATVLTNRQIEVLRLVADGLGTDEIAESLGISVETVRNHVRNILSRLGVHSRVEAVSVAHRRHLI